MFTLDRPLPEGPLAQGDILAEIIQYRVDAPAIEQEEVEAVPICYDRVAVLTQPCDLQNDFKARYPDRVDASDEFTNRPGKYLLDGIILCELQEETKFHNPDRGVNTKVFRRAQKNEQDRYHCIGPIGANDEDGYSLYADFKRIWVCPTQALYDAIENNPRRRIGIIPRPYIDYFVQRCYAFHSRIAVPDPVNDIPDREE